MRVERFAYELPEDLVAQEATTDREAARLLVLPAAGGIVHEHVRNLAELVPRGSLVVVNDTRVLRARIMGAKRNTGGKVEIFLVRKLEDEGDTQRWLAMTRASKALRSGTQVVKDSLAVDIESRGDDGLFVVRLSSRDDAPLEAAITRAGQVPLPPYIKREPRAEDEERYQTVFARVPGAIAAPTAGLHLTRALLDRLEARGCEIATLTLHVGLGTFQPVAALDLDDHPMHAEDFEVSAALARAIERARERHAEVVAVGTTVVRALESARDPDRQGHARACAERTRLLIQPGHGFGVVDRLLTNFHLPRSTLLALVCAFAGTERVLDAYRAAVRERYRFFSYGDAMLLERHEGSRA